MDVQPIRVSRQHSEDGRTHEFAIGAPGKALRAHVRRYCDYAEHSPTPLRRRQLPATEITLIIGFEQELHVSGPYSANRPERHDSFLAAMHESYSVTEFAGNSRGVEVNLTPFGARMLLGCPMDELANRVIPLEDVLGQEGRRLPDRLHEAAGPQQRFELLDALLASRIADSPAPVPAVTWAWRQLQDRDGLVGIGELTRELGCSRRYLVGQFRDQVGLPPKLVARILRFRRAVAALETDDGRRFAEIAQQCGYFDQPHLNREFRDLAGVTPSDVIASRLPAGLGLAA
jgi:AraC-like DNA-binding protein